ncbi:MAG: hypothetical protein JXB48_22935 [Candidatus Latescibacteria bacterium]|nr:hypothetical protein [Candidatus Latescibacterota bacterium]
MILNKNRINLDKFKIIINLTCIVCLSLKICHAGTGLSNEVILDRRWRNLETSHSLNFNPSFSAYNEKITGTLIYSNAQLNTANLYNVQCTAPLSAEWNWGLTLGMSYTGMSSGDIEKTTWKNGIVDKIGNSIDYHEHYGTISAAILMHERITKKISFFKNIAFGVNLNGAYKSNFGLPITDFSLDLGVSRFYSDTSFFSKNVIGLSLLNPFSLSKNDFLEPLYTPDIGLSWYLQKKYRNIIFNTEIELNMRSFWDYRSNNDRKDIFLQVGACYQLYSLYLQYGKNLSMLPGNSYWGAALKVSLPKFNSSEGLKEKIYDPGELDASFAYQLIGSFPDEQTAQPTNSGYFSVALGIPREKKFACGPFDIRFKVCGNCNTLFQSAKLNLSAEKYWNAYALFNFYIVNCPQDDSIPAARVYSTLCLEKMHLVNYAYIKYQETKGTLIKLKETITGTPNGKKVAELIEQQINAVDLGILRCKIKLSEKKKYYFNIATKADSAEKSSDALNYEWHETGDVTFPDSLETENSNNFIAQQFKLICESEAMNAIKQEAFYYYGQYQLNSGNLKEAIEAFDTLTDKNISISAYAQFSKLNAFLIQNASAELIGQSFNNSLKYVDKPCYSELKNRIIIKRAEFAYESLREHMETIKEQNDSAVVILKNEIQNIAELVDSIAKQSEFIQEIFIDDHKMIGLFDSLKSSLKATNDSLLASVVIGQETNNLLSEKLRERIDLFVKQLIGVLSTIDSSIIEHAIKKGANVSSNSSFTYLKTAIKSMLTSTKEINSHITTCNNQYRLNKERDRSITMALNELSEIPETSHVYIEALSIKMWSHDLLKQWGKCEQTADKIRKCKNVMAEEIKADANLLSASIYFRNQVLSILKDKNECDKIAKQRLKIDALLKEARYNMDSLNNFLVVNNPIDMKIDSLSAGIATTIKEYDDEMQKTADLPNLIETHGNKIKKMQKTLLYYFVIRDRMKQYSGMLERFNDIINDINWVALKNIDTRKKYCQDKEINELDEEIKKAKQQLKQTK